MSLRIARYEWSPLVLSVSNRALPFSLSPRPASVQMPSLLRNVHPGIQFQHFHIQVKGCKEVTTARSSNRARRLGMGKLNVLTGPPSVEFVWHLETCNLLKEDHVSTFRGMKSVSLESSQSKRDTGQASGCRQGPREKVPFLVMGA